MDFELSEADLMVQKAARDFAVKELEPRAALADTDPDFGRDTVGLLRRHNYFSLMIPEEYGGQGLNGFEMILVYEQLSRSCLSTATILGAHNLGGYALLLFGSDEQKRRYLPRLATGEMIAAFALTEANAGSDPASIATTAARDGDEYVLNGTKQFITNGEIASFFMIFAKTDPSRGIRGISTLIAEMGTPGLGIGRAENKMGIRGSSQTEVIMENARVPAANLLGKEGEGFRIAMSVLDRARPGVGAQSIGIAQGALDLATKYAKERVVFGTPIAEFQAIRFSLAEMATQLEAARLLTYRAAKLASEGKGRFSKESAMAKLFGSEMAHFVVDRALQIHGGYGYMKEYAIERLYRDQRILEIYEGTTEIQKHVIAGALLR